MVHKILSNYNIFYLQIILSMIFYQIHYFHMRQKCLRRKNNFFLIISNDQVLCVFPTSWTFRPNPLFETALSVAWKALMATAWSSQVFMIYWGRWGPSIEAPIFLLLLMTSDIDAKIPRCHKHGPKNSITQIPNNQSISEV